MSKTKTTLSIIITAIFAITLTLTVTSTNLFTSKVSAETRQTKRIKSFSAEAGDKMPTKTVDNQVNKFLETHNGKIVNSQATAVQSVSFGAVYVYTYTVTIEY